MMHYLVDDNGTVVNIIDYKEGTPFTPDKGLTLVSSDIVAEIGWIYSNSNFTNPNQQL